MRKRALIGVYLAVLAIIVVAASFGRVRGSLAGDAAATPVWAKRIESNGKSIQTYRGLADSQGGCLAVGESGFSWDDLDAWAVHLDKTGKILNQMTYGGKTHERLISICESVDTGYLAAGRTRFDAWGDQGGYGLLMKLGADLNLIWAKTVSASRTENWIERILKLNKAQGYLAIMKFRENYSISRAIMRLNSSGSVVWAFKLGDNKMSFDIREVLQAPDGGFFLAGSVHSLLEDDAIIVKIDGNGNFKWAKKLGEAGASSNIRIESAYLTGSNNLMVFGGRSGAGLALKLDLNGNVKWQYLYKGPSQIPGFLKYGLPGEGGGFYFVGSDLANDSENVFIKCDSTGRILSKKYYRAFSGSTLHEYMSHAFRASDGGIFILNTEVWPSDVAIAKMNTSGNLPQKCPPMSWNVTRSKTKYKMSNLSVPYASVKVTVKSTTISARSVSFAASDACD
jgi:hypothetical protein